MFTARVTGIAAPSVVVTAPSTSPWLAGPAAGDATPITRGHGHGQLMVDLVEVFEHQWMCGCSTSPSSNRYAVMMCSFSHAAMLFQNRVAWE
ncbi:hypothetical protein Cs7R123_05130 [Catellatospora sp. TT07R-123]|nr:hypothetical protein Cs7R123_05130 [Catellatospora sp. TT07R-123]